MRPNWITIAIMPAVCGALIGLVVTEVALRYQLPLRVVGESRYNAVGDKREGVPKQVRRRPRALSTSQPTLLGRQLLPMVRPPPLLLIRQPKMSLRGGLS